MFRVQKKTKIFDAFAFTLTDALVTLPNNTEAHYHVIEHPGAAVIIPLFDNHDILLLKQYRFATGKTLYELPAGTMEKGEKPLQCARRELIEETGYRGRYFKKLTAIYSAPGFCNELLHIFLATKLTPDIANPEEGEIFTLHRIPLAQALEMTYNGKIYDAKTIVGIHLTAKVVHDNRKR